MRKISWSAAILALGLAACGSSETTDEAATDATAAADAEAAPRQAVADLMMADGTPAGTVTASEADGGIEIALNAEGVTTGNHGVHVHMIGLCEAPGFTSAEGHWNPGSRQHGLENPEGSHAGDMPNLTVAEDGTGTLDFTLEGGTFDQLLDEDGSAFIIHAGEDDQVTDPSGDSGDRVACGVFAAS